MTEHPGRHDHRHPSGWRVDPAPDGRGTPPAPKQPRRRRSLLGYILLLVVVLAFNSWMASRIQQPEQRVRVPYSPVFLEQVEAGNVSSISSQEATVHGRFRRAVRYPPGDRNAEPTHLFVTEVPAFADTEELSSLLRRKEVAVNAKAPEEGPSVIESLLSGLLPTLLLVGLMVWLLRRATGGAGGIGAFGRSRARRVEPSAERVTFADIAGIDEAKAELAEIVDFLKSPDKYRKVGGRIPRGVLLTGPPGAGKTLLARALAGEAGVPFFSISASEFVEMFVGVGASRVRDLFSQAKADAPAIIFIDELDAIGRSRAGAIGGFGGGHDEREQTLNQILTEMDGFDPSIGVIVLSATNRPEVLDPALLRPGRFDRRVAVQPPDTGGRRAILAVHTRSVPLHDDVDLDRLAAMTAGMVGADLANVVNEAALLAARRTHDRVTMQDISDALEKLILGTERRIMLSPAERERTAYHEAGHALVGILTPGADPVRKVSIVPRGRALGVTLSAPEADRFSYPRSYLSAKIAVALGGRVAEELVYGDITTGAEEDIRQLTEVARGMVARWGMSDAVGPIAVGAAEGTTPQWPSGTEVSPETLHLVDAEVRRIVDEAHTAVTTLLTDHRDTLDRLAHALLERETLDEHEAQAAAGIPAAPAAGESRAAPPVPGSSERRIESHH
jgi:cell division protease FtsH